MRREYMYGAVLTFIISVFSVLVFSSHSYTEDDKNQQAFHNEYKVRSIKLPEQLSFAGEQIPMDDPDLMERYDKELLTNIYWQSQTLLFIKRAYKYFPVIETILKEQGIPDDFKYLAVAESGLQYQVVSSSNATGYWQFLEGTGKKYGLVINDEVDERYHLEKSTLAACAYFKEAYHEFGSWALVAASYNMGIEGVRKQLLGQKVNTYHDLYLNAETSRYLFRIMAIKDILERPEQYGFYVPAEQRYKAVNTYKVKINTAIPNIAQYAADNGTTYRWIKLLNPWMRKNVLNVINPNGATYFMAMPKQQAKSADYASSIINDTISIEQTHFKTEIK